jgi:multidrug efflux system outer membrane protein
MRRALALALSATALAGCTLEPTYVRPTPAVPQTWPVGAAYPAASAAPLPSLSYRDIFKDPHLQAIIDQALANNQNLQIAMANVTIARSQYQIQRAQLLPRIVATGNATETQGRATTSQSTGAPGRTTTTSTTTTRSYDAGIGFSSFDIDLFGRLRSLSHAAQDLYFASEAGVHTARLILVSQVASAYLTLAADRSLLAISVGTEASDAKSVELNRALVTGGVVPRTNLALAQTLLDQARSDRANLTTIVAQDRNALELLVGAPVADAELPPSIEAVDGLLGEIPAGLDSRILLRRPDVVQSEYQLRSANAQIGAARANFFPTISLTALAGAASPTLSALFSGNNYNWNISAGAAQTIFAGGANVANLKLTKGQRDLAVAQYQLAIQTAFREVADGLARRGTIDDQLRAQTSLEAAARDNYMLSDARYRQGIDPYLNSLIAERTFYSAQQTLTATRFLKASNLVTLYNVLGGDQLIDAMPPPKTAKR